MCKFLKYIMSMLIVLAVLVSLLYYARASIFVPFIQKYIRAKIGHEIKFDNFYILPQTFSLAFTNVKVDNVFAVKKITFNLSPIKFFAYIAAPMKCISRIDISKLEVSLNANSKDKNVSSDKNNTAFKLPESKITIFIDEAVIKNNKEILKIIDARILLGPNQISLDSMIYALGIPIKINSHIKRAAGNIFNTSSILAAENKLDMLVNSSGTVDLSSLDITQNIAVEKLIYSGFKLNGSSGIFSKTGNACKISLSGGFGKFEFNSSADGVAEAKSKIDISEINKSMSGNINLNFKRQNDTAVFGLNIVDLVVFGFRFRNFNLSGMKNHNGIYDMLCIYGTGGKIKIGYTRNGNYKACLVIGNKTAGTVKGNTETGEVAVDIKNVDVAYAPVIPFMWKDAKGIVNISGAIDEVSGQIDFAFKSLNVSTGINSANVMGTINRSNDMYVFNFYKNDNSFVLNSVIKSGEIVSADFKFVSINISDILRICGYSKYSVLGTVSGRVKYEKNSGAEFDIKAFNGILYSNKFKKIEAKGDVNLDRINIERFILKNDSDEITADIMGLLGFTKANSVSSVYVNVRDINVGGVKVSGYASFQGSLSDNDEIKGIIESAGSNVSGVSLGNLLADATISTKKFEISNLKSNNGIEASVRADFKENKLSGNLSFKNTDIKGVYNGVSGLLDSTVKFSGELDNPDVRIAACIKKGKYLFQSFSFLSDLEYRNSILKVDKAVLSADKTKVALKGNYLNGGIISLTVENLTERIINTFVGFRTPLKGSFSGDGVLMAKDGKQCLKMSLQAKKAYVKTLKLNDVKSDIEINGYNIAINSASARILDSEIKVDKGFFNIEDGKYGLNLSLINAHAGPFDLFGSIKLSGEIIKRKGGSIYTGAIDLQNLWINKYKLSYCRFDYNIKDKTLEFLQKADGVNLYDSSGLIVFGDIISVKKFNISKDKTCLDLKADFSNDSVDVEIEGSNIDWRFITDVLNLPIAVRGSININAGLSGRIGQPKGSISITSVNGSVMETPYDNFDVEVDFSDNYAHIKKAVVFKRNEISMSVHGAFPLWFDKTLSEKMQNKPIDVTYEVEDSKLSILKYLSGGYIKPYSGKMLIKGSVEGTYAKISSNGRLSAMGGSFEIENYIDKAKDMSIEMSLIEDLVKIDKFSFKSGPGKLNAYGQLRLNKFNVRDFDIRLVTGNKGIFLRVPQLPIMSIMGDKSLLQDYSAGELGFDIRVHGSPAEPKVAGSILLENTRFTFPGDGSDEDIDSFIPKNTEFDLKLLTAKNTRFENSFVYALINGFLYIRGPYNNLRTNGIIEASKGRINYFGIGFDIVNAKVEVVDRTHENQVYVTAEGETAVFLKKENKPETIKLIVDRTEISKISMESIKFSSKDNPNIDSHTALEKIVGTKRDIDINAPGLGIISNFMIKQRVLRLIDQLLTMPFAKTVLRKTGLIDDFRVSYSQIDTDVSQSDKFSNLFVGNKYSIEKNLTSQILFGYSILLDELHKELDLRHEIEVRYKLTDNLFLIGSYELNLNEYSRQPDRRLMLQYQVRFGSPAKE
ncbi:translocation/assembly module TamB domain-containing protein [Candidatus Endomicrobiellum agilis]|uniref:translocation/assembly module TamB domain-containing protein n=1 Tax=Candidatus Endomicrobiellum agilis TaxID=3238957 RepID=UPI00358C7728|nr:translocation/assembly module TamB [Endomicrobium sp.]